MKHASGWTLARIGKTVLTLVAAAMGAAVLTNSSCNLTNKAPTVPVISGPSSGVVGVAVTFKATATDPDGDSVAFGFDWSDSSGPTWTSFVASGETLSVSRTFTDSGTFTVRVKAKDAKGKASDWCSPESLHVINIVRDYPDSVYAEIAIADGGRAGAITPDGEYLYVATGLNAPWEVTPIRLADRSALPPVTFSDYPNDVASSVDGSHVYVSLRDAHKVAAIRTADNVIDREVTVVGTPQHMATTPDGNLLLVTETDPDRVMFLRVSDLAGVDSVAAGYLPIRIIADQLGTYAYASSYNGIQVLDIASHRLIDSLTAVQSPTRFGLSRDGRFLYAANQADSGFAVVRLSDRTVQNRVNMHTPQIGAFAATPSDDYLMFTYYRGIQYVDTRAYAVVDSLVNPAESWRALVMHPTADTMYMVGWNKVYIIGPRQ